MATYLLMGLRFSKEFASQLVKGVQNMRESTTYQAILNEGRDEGLIAGRIAGEQRMLIRLGTKRFGEPNAATLASLEAIHDIDRLEVLGVRILDSDLQSWDDLLRTP
jgi:predicted transposase YdaD